MDSAADLDFKEWTEWLDREVAAGRDPAPPERARVPQGLSVSLGDAVGIDPGLFAAICGREGANGAALGSQFGQHAAADALPPSPVLAALTEAAVADVARLSDDQLIGVLHAARRQENREAWKKALVTAEFARRRAAEFAAAEARGAPVHCRPGQFPGEELAMELLVGPVQASHAIDDATDLATRLPATLAGMAAGLIDAARAGVIAFYTRALSPADAALADGILASLAPALRLDQLVRRAAAMEMRLAPEAVKARKEHARRTGQRVEVRREDSGNASVAAREMGTVDALASKAHIHALALRLRRGGLPGTLDQLRVLVFADLTAGRDPLDRIDRPDGSPAATGTVGQDFRMPMPDRPPSLGNAPSPGDAASREGGSFGGGAGSAGEVPSRDGASSSGAPADEAHGPGPGAGDTRTGRGLPGSAGSGRGGPPDDDRDHDCGYGPGDTGPAGRPPAPMPATINLVVHAGTLFGWDTRPTEAGGWGLLDAEETRAIVAAASRHSATRWCLTLIGRDGTALAHGCAPGRHSWGPGVNQGAGPPNAAGRATPSAGRAARFADFVRRLNVPLTAIAKDGCDHSAAERHYTPSRRLAHLVRARTVTCDAPGCAAQAVQADLDHTKPYPQGPTDQCNLGPKCRRHHKVKQAPGWEVEQPEPGVIRWTLPSGRTYATRPTDYVG